MKSMNKVQLIGKVGKTPEFKTLPNQVMLVKFPMATNESYKNKAGEVVEKTVWHNITIWGKLAEIVKNYVDKGSSLFIEGKITQDEYKDADGKTKFYVGIEASEINMLDPKPVNQNQSMN